MNEKWIKFYAQNRSGFTLCVSLWLKILASNGKIILNSEVYSLVKSISPAMESTGLYVCMSVVCIDLISDA